MKSKVAALPEPQSRPEMFALLWAFLQRRLKERRAVSAVGVPANITHRLPGANGYDQDFNWRADVPVESEGRVLLGGVLRAYPDGLRPKPETLSLLLDVVDELQRDGLLRPAWDGSAALLITHRGAELLDANATPPTATSTNATAQATTVAKPPRVHAANDLPFKDFEFLGYIKSGGFAGVWRARDPLLGREVAVKVFPFTETALPAALEHARALMNIDHPNVVSIYEVVSVRDPEGSGRIVEAVVMALIDGADLGEHLIGPRFSLDRVGRFGTEILSGLGAFHAIGQFHLDLHEGNVMIDKTGRVRIVDASVRGGPAVWASTTRIRNNSLDVDYARNLLTRMLNHSDADAESVGVFGRTTRDVASLDGLRAAFVLAVTPPLVLGWKLELTPPDSNAWLTATTPAARCRRRILAELYTAYMDSPSAWSGWTKETDTDITTIVRESEWLQAQGHIEAQISADGISVNAILTTHGRDFVETSDALRLLAETRAPR